MKRSGIVLELNKKRAVVMTTEAEFITIKREPKMFTGARVELNQPAVPGFAFPGFGLFRANPQTAGLAGLAFAFIVILTFTFFFQMNDYRNTSNNYAYVTVDINPSVELVLDTKINVIQARNLNKDGRSLLQGSDLKDMPLGQALLTLVNRAEQNHYFDHQAGKYILVSAATNLRAQEKPDLLEKSIATFQAKLTERKIQLQYIKATLSQRKLALQNHLSTGRYALLTSTGATGRTIDLKTAKTGNIGRLLNQAGLLDKAQKPNTDDLRGPDSKKLKDHQPNNNVSKDEIQPDGVISNQNGRKQQRLTQPDSHDPKPTSLHSNDINGSRNPNSELKSNSNRDNRNSNDTGNDGTKTGSSSNNPGNSKR